MASKWDKLIDGSDIKGVTQTQTTPAKNLTNLPAAKEKLISGSDIKGGQKTTSATTKKTSTPSIKISTGSSITTTSSKPASEQKYTPQAPQVTQQIIPDFDKMRSDYEAQRAIEMEALERYLSESRDSYIANQEAILQANLDMQLAELENALNQAVADGELSVREAEQQFEQQKQALEKQAYLASERTQLYGQEMGLQNSQQMVGLIQGDTARAMELSNQNMSERDKRIADIRTRIDNIRNQYRTSVNLANQQFRTGMAQAQSQADMIFNQNMFGLKQEDYIANRQQYFQELNMAVQQKYNIDMANLESTLAIDRMNIQHGLDLEKMEVQLQHDIKKMGIENKYRMQQIAAQAAAQMRAAEAEFQRQLRLADPNTPEGRIMAQKAEAEFAQKLKQAQITTMVTAKTEALAEQSRMTSKPTAPKDYSSANYLGGVANPNAPVGIGGTLANLLTGYNSKQQQYQQDMARWNEQQAIDKMLQSYLVF
jgi:hypothetical protein